MRYFWYILKIKISEPEVTSPTIFANILFQTVWL